jgi:D-tyrosyl-tRNA(Tyr) deacylase
MKLLLQRVKHASVSVDNKQISSIQKGMLVFVGLEKTDTIAQLEKMANKLLSFRLFADENDKMNLDISQINGEILLVSQFTLVANTNDGTRPSFTPAMLYQEANNAMEKFVKLVQAKHPNTHTGVFGADMQVSLINDGPITFSLQA